METDRGGPARDSGGMPWAWGGKLQEETEWFPSRSLEQLGGPCAACGALEDATVLTLGQPQIPWGRGEGGLGQWLSNSDVY